MSSEATAKDLKPGPRATDEFHFEHRLFAIDGCVFRKAGDGRTVALCVPLGTVMASVPLEKLPTMFEIPVDSDDARLLKRVGEALKYVREVRPGDSIPSEIIDGRASWMVDEKYLHAAKARISLQLVAWLSGGHTGPLELHELIARADDPEMRRSVRQAFDQVAEKLGLGPDRRDEVVALVDRLAVEFSYIEALRDRFKELRRIVATLNSLCSVYRRERQVSEMIVRCLALLRKPIQAIFDRFDNLDANTGEVVNTLKRFEPQVAYVRTVRDELREQLLMWEELLTTWNAVKPNLGPPAEDAVRATYRFAARNFSLAQAWSGT